MPSYPGIEFKPRDDQLLTFYLPKKIAGGRDALGIPSYLICDFDVFSTEPWNLPARDFRYQNDRKDMHFFSPRRAISSKKCTARNVKRTAGCVFWNGKGKEQDVFYESRHVGYKTRLTFVSTEGGKRSNTNWIMHEFHLKPSENNNKFDSMVICRMHKNKTKEDREEGADADSGVAAIIVQDEQGTASAATHVEERPLKRMRVEASSSLPSSPFIPCKEVEAFNQLISTMDEKQHTVFEQEVEVDERQVTEMLLKEHEMMKNHSNAAAESGADTSICDKQQHMYRTDLERASGLRDAATSMILRPVPWLTLKHLFSPRHHLHTCHHHGFALLL